MSVSAKRFMWVMATGVLLCASGICLAQEGEQAPATNAEPAVMNAEMTPAPSPAPEASEPAAAATPSKEAMAPQWIWGEVVSVDKSNNQVQIKHLDYETYEEVTKVIQADAGTLYENVGGIGDLKPGDSVTVDFKMKDGAQVAELIVVDKNRAATDSNANAAPAATSEETAASAAAPQEPPPAAMLQEAVGNEAAAAAPLVEAPAPLAAEAAAASQDQGPSSQEPETLPVPTGKKGQIPLGRI